MWNENQQRNGIAYKIPRYTYGVFSQQMALTCTIIKTEKIYTICRLVRLRGFNKNTK